MNAKQAFVFIAGQFASKHHMAWQKDRRAERSVKSCMGTSAANASGQSQMTSVEGVHKMIKWTDGSLRQRDGEKYKSLRTSSQCNS